MLGSLPFLPTLLPGLGRHGRRRRRWMFPLSSISRRFSLPPFWTSDWLGRNKWTWMSAALPTPQFLWTPSTEYKTHSVPNEIRVNGGQPLSTLNQEWWRVPYWPTRWHTTNSNSTAVTGPQARLRAEAQHLQDWELFLLSLCAQVVLKSITSNYWKNIKHMLLN